MSPGRKKPQSPAAAATIAFIADQGAPARAAALLIAAELLIAVTLAGLAAPLALAGPSTPAHAIAESRHATAGSLIRALRALGAAVKFEQKIRQPFFEVPADILEVDGEGVQVYVFRDPAAALKAATRVSPDGRSIGTARPFWIGPPHFYRRSNLLVLYLGDSPQILERLHAALGAQFAGV